MEGPRLTLPAEVCAQVVQYAHSSDLPALGCTSKALQVLAETRLYQHVIMKDPTSIYRMSLALHARDFCRAPYVKRLWVYQDTRCSRGVWAEELWIVIRNILAKLENLEIIYIFDENCTNTWIFEPRVLSFRLKEANLGFSWDETFVSFLETQTELRALTIQVPDEDEHTRRILAPDSLQKLESFDGPLFIAADFITSPLTRLNTRVDEENAPLFSTYITTLAHSNKTLRSINVLHIPEYLVSDSLRVLASSYLSSTLRYIGILNLPATEHHDIHRSLLKFQCLEVVQVDISHWAPVPMFCHFPMLATELRTYCFTLRSMLIWVNTHQYLGRYDNERWVFQQLPGPRHPSRDVQWREY
ncbi:hypothetical protein BC835DRAFT_1269369 [Cytidiella melzeri]|nr:hypothetical protein BC835DRAFT_1269369 [Cytidiella melzeri]